MYRVCKVKKYCASTQIPLGSCSDSIYARFQAGLGRVLVKSTRVQVQVLEKMTSTSRPTNTSTGFSKVLE